MRAAFFESTVYRSDGMPASLRYRKGLAVVFFLVAERRPVARKELLSLLWTDTEDATAKNGLRVVLADIRKKLGSILDGDRHVVTLNDDGRITSDLEEFEAWARDGAPEGETPSTSMVGPLLSGFTFDDAPEFSEWIETLRDRVARVGIEAWIRMSDAALREARDADAIDALHEALRFRSWDESTHRRLIRLLASLGRLDEARLQVETCKQELRRHVHDEPSDVLVTLAQSLAARESSVLGMPTPAPSPYGIVGRTNDILAIERAFANDDARIVVVAGAPGMGTSTVARAAARVVAPRFLGGVTTIDARTAATEEAFRTIVHTALPQERSVPSLVLIDDVPDLSWLGKVIPELVRHDAHRSFLVSGSGPVDRDLGVVWILNGLPTPSRDATDTCNPATTLTLRAMKHAGSQPSGTLRDDPRFGRAIRRTGGHPLSLIHLGMWIAELGIATVDVQFDALLANVAPSDVATTVRSLRDAFDPAVQRLTMETRGTLTALSVFRGPFELATARRVTQRDEARLARDVRTLQRHHLIEYRPSIGGGATLQLVGGLAFQLRQGDDATLARLRDVHAAWIGDLLEEAHIAALRHDQQRTFARVEPLLDDVDAALDHLASRGHGEDALRVASHAWRFHDMAGRIEPAIDRLNQLVTSFADGCDPLLHSDALTAIGSLKLKQGRLDEARVAYESGLALREREGDGNRIVGSLNNLAVLDGMTGAFEDAANRFREVHEHADRVGETWIAAAALVNRGHALTEAGRCDVALEAYQRGAGRMKAIGDQHGRLGALLGVIHASAACGNGALVSSAVVEWTSLMAHPDGVRDAERLALPTHVTSEKLRTFGYETLAAKLDHALDVQRNK